jgi:hypothetical protein
MGEYWPRDKQHFSLDNHVVALLNSAQAERNENDDSALTFDLNANLFGQETQNHVRPNDRPLAHARPARIRCRRCGFVSVCGE